MYGLSSSTEAKKQLPKKAIYAKFDLKPTQRESFDADVSTLYIVGVVSPRTVPAIAEGEEVKEFYVLSVQLKRKEYDPKNIALLTKLIPQRMVLALHYGDEVQFAIHHTKLITSAWRNVILNECEESQHLVLQGLTLDVTWENIVKSIGHIEVEEGNTLTEQIATDDKRAKLLAQIATLERKMASEKQPRRKRVYFEQIKKLKTII